MQTKVEMNRTEKDAVAVEKTAQNSSGQGSEKINRLSGRSAGSQNNTQPRPAERTNNAEKKRSPEIF